MEQKVVTVVGSTGSLGLKIVKELLNNDIHVRAIIRETSNRTGLQNLGISDLVIGDMMDPASLKKALSVAPKSDAVIACAAGYTGHTKGDSPKTDTEGYRNLVDATKTAGISRFVLISILECDKAPNVPHFYHKYLVEKYLMEKGQPYIALRAGAFLDQAKDFVLPNIKKGIFPVFISGVDYGMIYTPDLARYASIAATRLSIDELSSIVDVGWTRPANGTNLTEAFSKILGYKIVPRPAFPFFVEKVIFPFLGLFTDRIKDLNCMIRWIRTGEYTSKNTKKQKELFDDLPTIEEAVERYCRDRNLIQPK